MPLQQQRLGVSLPLPQTDLTTSLALACEMERRGYSDAWSSEASGADGFSILAALAMRTERLRLGISIVPIFTRPPALLAMSAASLQDLSRGRFWLGLGTSTEAVVERWMGLRLDRPLTRMRETVEVIRQALRGERVRFAGQTVRVDGFQLGVPAPALVPIVVAALGPRMLRLAGEIGDGVTLYNAARSAVPDLLATVREGAEAAGRAAPPTEVVMRVGVAVDEDDERLRAVLRRDLAGYGSTAAYNAFFARQGFAEEAAGMRAAWERRDGASAAAAVSDRMLDEIFIFGSAAECRRRADALFQAGVTTLVVMPLSVHPDAAERARRRRAVLECLAQPTPV